MTFGIITANKLFTPPTRVDRDHLDLQTNTRWVGRHPPVDWPLEKYSISYREGDPSSTKLSTVGLDPPILATPVYFVNLKERQLTSIQAYGSAAAQDPSERELTGFDLTFTDGSTETVGHKPHQALSTGLNMLVEMEEGENVTDLTLQLCSEVKRFVLPNGTLWDSGT